MKNRKMTKKISDDYQLEYDAVLFCSGLNRNEFRIVLSINRTAQCLDRVSGMLLLQTIRHDIRVYNKSQYRTVQYSTVRYGTVVFD